MLTSADESGDSVTDLQASNALANLLDDTGIIAARNRTWRCGFGNVLPVGGVECHGFCLYENPIIACEFRKGYISLEDCNVLGLVYDRSLGGHFENVIRKQGASQCSWFVDDGAMSDGV
jgi:hypothetical protein